MRSRELVSSWSGLAISLCISATLAACAGVPVLGDRTREHVDWVAQVRAAGTDRRTALWRQVGSDTSAETRFQRAVLQGFSGHPGHNPEAGTATLQALAEDGPSDLAVVARWRLEELRSERECRAEVTALKERLGKVADIERKTAPTAGGE